jgi:hypothetical protein
VKRKNDPTGRVFTPNDYLRLENYLIDGAGVSGSHGAVTIEKDGTIKPYMRYNKSTPIPEPDKYVDIV